MSDDAAETTTGTGGDGAVFTRILIATDGSPGAAEATRLGAALAKATGAEVLLVYVANMPAAVATGIATLPEYADSYIDSMRDHAFGVSGTILDDLGVAHTRVVVTGPPAGAIIEEAKRRDCDAIVIGHTGLSGVERFFMGSVADRVLHKAPCTVIRAPAPTDAADA